MSFGPHRPLRLLVEGWRFSPNSFAVVNMYQLLSLMNRADVRLFHRDRPYWRNDTFYEVSGLWRELDEDRVRAIPPPPEGEGLDATLRIEFPIRPVPDPAVRRTFIFTQAEWGIIEDAKCGHLKASDILARRDVSYITASEFSKQGFVRTGCPPDNCHVVPHGFDPSIMHPLSIEKRDALRASFGWGDKTVYLTVSTLGPNKGLPCLLAGFAHAAGRVSNALLFIKGSKLSVSENAIASALRELPKRLRKRIADRVIYNDSDMSFAALAQLYQAADCYLAPYHAEGFNIPVLEAIACGCPAICTAGGPTDEFTTSAFAKRIPSRFETDTGLEAKLGAGARRLVPDCDRFAELIVEASCDEPWRASAREAGPAFVRERYTWDRVTEQLIGVLRGVLASH